MFARYYVYLDHPFADVWAVVFARPSHDVLALDGEAGEELLARVGIRVAGIPIYKRVKLEVGTPYAVRREAQVVLPVRWRPTGGPPLFPHMYGDLAFQPFGTDRTQMTLNAGYHPPGGRLGAAVDEAALHLLADATVRDFALRLAASIDHALAPTAA